MCVSVCLVVVVVMMWLMFFFIRTNSINGIKEKGERGIRRTWWTAFTFGSALLKQAFKLNARSQPSPAGYRHLRIMWMNVKWISLSSLNDSCKPTKSILPSGKMKPISCRRQSVENSKKTWNCSINAGIFLNNDTTSNKTAT